LTQQQHYQRRKLFCAKAGSFSSPLAQKMTVFSFHLPNFGKNQSVFGKNHPELAAPVYRKTGRFIAETSRISVFPVFTVPPSVRFGRIFLIFTDFCRTFQKPTGSVASDFPYSVDFSNTADGMAWHNVILVHSSLTVSACAGPSVPCPQNDKLAR
jgi:hypothetical protein